MTDSNTCKATVITIHKASEVPLQPINGKPTLVYWDIVGIVHPLRMALATANVEWNDVRMVCGQSKDSQANKKEWFQAKKVLQEKKILEFPNLPYYLDTDVQLVQTDAILRYLGNKFNLMGNGTVQVHRADMLMEEARDLDSTIVRLSYEEGGPAVAKWLCSSDLRDKLQVWDELIRASGAFVTGSTITVVDFKLYTFLYKFQVAQASLMISDCQVPALPFWVPAYLDLVQKATPQLEAYLKSPDMRIPINNPHALFDNF
ncbi:S-transferase Mu [Seminavis robusta]|uniref:glutathione transferase n=1 Tax=Seminavis robusta TaxID=568900 RepID=A0A9N8DMQ7_9STRA|nr:S-transferase Mu [Seminavis robusta]|eukprot:Sro219_g090260.1 S-transferase Mu (260) ;mRNA; f:2840-3619